MSPLNRCFSMPARQRGAIGLVSALTLGLALLFMITVIDSGRLYLEKRSLQRIADMAALEAASRKGNCSSAATASLYATQSATRNGFTPNTDGRTLSTLCGTLSVNAADSRRSFVANAASTDVIRVVVSHPVPASIAAGIASLFSGTAPSANVQLSATAVAAATPPLAQLTIRNALLTVDSTKAILLNALIGGLLGGTLNLSVASWQSLIDTKLNLLGYLDRLKIDLNITAAGYEKVLSTEVTIKQLIQSNINFLLTKGLLSTDNAIIGLEEIKAAAGGTTIKLGDLIKIQGGDNVAALGADMSIFNIIQGLAQVANKEKGIAANFQINLLNLARVKTQIRVIEPPQLSSIGDPSKIKSTVPVLDDPNRIYVRTAQIRALVSVELPVLSSVVTPVLNTVTSTLVGNLTPVLNSALTLNIKGLIGSISCIIGTPCLASDFQFLNSSSGNGPKIDLSLTLTSAESYVTGYSCKSNSDKSLSTHTTASFINAKLGSISDSAGFPASNLPDAVTALPLPIVDIGTKTCTQTLLGLLGSNCGPRNSFGGGGIGISFNTLNTETLANSSNTTFSAPNLPEVGQAPYYSVKNTHIVPSSILDGIVSGVKVDIYKPANGNVLGSTISVLSSLLSDTLNELDKIIENTLKPVLAAILDPLLDALGVTVTPVDVGANLSCNFGQATLSL